MRLQMFNFAPYFNSLKKALCLTEMSSNKILVNTLVSAVLLAVPTGCANQSRNTGSQDIIASSLPTREEYVADNDIAMTVRSIVDAINVGEPLDTAEYNFSGVLTDGEGTPLYTDVQGNPGEWEVDVLNEKSVRIHNLYLGDLLPNHLTDYLTTTLELTDADIESTDEYDDDDETSLEVYNFGTGDIRFETREAFAPNGLEGPLMSIVIASRSDMQN